MDDIEVQTEPNFDGQYDEYVKRVEVKQMDENEKNVHVICRLVSYGGKTLCVWKF